MSIITKIFVIVHDEWRKNKMCITLDDWCESESVICLEGIGRDVEILFVASDKF